MLKNLEICLITACLAAGLNLIEELFEELFEELIEELSEGPLQQSPWTPISNAGALEPHAALSIAESRPVSQVVSSAVSPANSRVAKSTDKNSPAPGSAGSVAGRGFTGGDDAPVAGPGFLWAAAALESDPDPEVREQAVYRLQDTINPLSMTLIEGALVDPDPAVREAAIDALAEIGDAAASRVLIHAYFSESEALREEIVHALAAMGDTSAADFLLTASYDQSAAVRGAALAYLETQ